MELDINTMTEEKFLEIWDTDKDAIRDWDDLREYLNEVIGPYETINDDIDTYKMRVYGRSIYKIKDRYFKVPWVEYNCDSEWLGEEIVEVQRKSYFKRIEVKEWSSMPD